MSWVGRKLIIRKDGIAIAGARAKAVRFNNEPIDVTYEEEDGFRHLLDVLDTRELVISIEGVLSAPHVEQLIRPKLDGELIDIEVEFPDESLIAADAYIQSLQITGEYRNAVMFSASLVLSGTFSRSLPLTRGTLWSWGSSTSGQNGQNATSGFTATPTIMLAAGGIEHDDWSFVDSNASNTFAIRNGMLYATGSHEQGRSAAGLTSGQYTRLTRVAASFDDWVFVRVGYYCSFGIRSNGWLYTWGENRDFITGLGVNTGFNTTPVRVGTQDGWTSADNTALASFGARNGQFYGWGGNFANSNGVSFENSNFPVTFITTPQLYSGVSSGVVDVGGIAFDTGSARVAGQILTFGDNGDGTTANGTTSGFRGPMAAAQGLPAGIRHLGAKPRWPNAFAIDATGRLWGWGFGQNGSLGMANGTYTVAALVDDGGDWRMANGGNIFAAGIRSGRLMTTGWRSTGRVGDGVNDSSSKIGFTSISDHEDWIFCRAGNAMGVGIRGVS